VRHRALRRYPPHWALAEFESSSSAIEGRATSVLVAIIDFFQSVALGAGAAPRVAPELKGASEMAHAVGAARSTSDRVADL
jgi:hypothetical protein